MANRPNSVTWQDVMSHEANRAAVSVNREANRAAGLAAIQREAQRKARLAPNVARQYEDVIDDDGEYKRREGEGERAPDPQFAEQLIWGVPPPWGVLSPPPPPPIPPRVLPNLVAARANLAAAAAARPLPPTPMGVPLFGGQVRRLGDLEAPDENARLLKNTSQQQKDAEFTQRTSHTTTMYRVAAVVFVLLAAALVIIQVTGHGSQFDIGLHFDSGAVYNVHAANVNWLIVAAALAFALACLGTQHTIQQEGNNLWTIFWTPLAIALIVANLAILSRIRDGFALALLCTLGYCVGVMEQIVAFNRKVSRTKKPLRQHWWLQLCSIAGWALILVVLWYTASWSQQNLDITATPLYVIPLLTVATVLLGIRIVSQIELFYDPSHLLKWGVWREAILLMSEVALVSVCGFIPL